MLRKDKVTVNYNGSKLVVTGTYFSGFNGSQYEPAEPASFIIDEVDDVKLWRWTDDLEVADELEAVALETYQDELESAEYLAADMAYEVLKDAKFDLA